jgi:hypothetical protein
LGKQLRNITLGSRTPEEAMAGMEWILRRAEGIDAGVAGAAVSASR